MHAHTVNQICMHTLTTLQKASNHLFFVLLGFFFSCHKAPQTSQKDMECTHNRDLVFIRITLHKQNQTTVNRWRGVCLGGGQAVFPNILFSPPDGLERNYYVSDNQTIRDIESTSGEGGRCLNRSTLTFLCLVFLSNQRRTGATLKLRQIEL